MRLSVFFVVIIGLLLSRFGFAEDDSQLKDPFASGPPIVTQMPAYSQWTITYTYGDLPKPPVPASGAPSNAPLSQRPLRVVVTKTDSVRHEEEDLEQNLESNLWVDGDVMVEQKPRNPELNAYMATAAAKNNDFPQLDWVSRSTFVGIESQQGRKCLVYKASVDLLEIIDPYAYKFGLQAKSEVPVTAYVDLQTRYPVLLQFEATSLEYTMNPAPSVSLVMPDEFAKAAAAMKARIQAAIPHPARP